MKNLVILTGAGMSSESGIRTFRDSGGLWDEYDVTEIVNRRVEVIKEKASKGVAIFTEQLLKSYGITK